jgi:hypothetical protein
MRCGRGIWREPIDRCTSCVAETSSAIWKPVLPPPTTSTGPGGSASGAVTVSDTGVIVAGRIGTVFIGGSIIAGTESGGATLLDSGAIRSGGALNSLFVGGNLDGNPAQSVLITAGRNDLTTGVAIGSISVAGFAEYARIAAGYSTLGTTLNGNGGSDTEASIGRIVVGGNWTGGTVLASVDDHDADGDAGDGDDTRVDFFEAEQSRIAAIIIKGTAGATPSAGDHYGFVAQEIAKVKVNGALVPLTAGANNDAPTPVPGAADLRVHEVPRT